MFMQLIGEAGHSVPLRRVAERFLNVRAELYGDHTLYLGVAKAA